ncbi:TetR/AcrR family transcriptional regulator [Streptomyces katsurahamanus]|uniref:TetR/AcrR family transcriptional regulator n=1 Tax=Streptomyces katsurahamanus TaxID=2577098 RepID=A0ABW9NQE5_9ACTN|nr:TetR/AcrR family transcriptional regulator [Streptomyces katsurahamanus]MQS35522.1 TetR/AcrR family transcriptional regulator [Streptomyces katsurahamanus]
MPTARESLLDAALAALAESPWSGVRMVDVAAAAGLSRQTLYNEFGSKDGLARALVRREADSYLHGVDRLLGERTGPVDPLVAIAEWTVGEARSRPLLRALLTGCWGERLPAPRPVRRGAPPAGVPAQRRADAGLPAPSDVVALVRDRSLAALERASCGGCGGCAGEVSGDLAFRCELVVRLALSCVIAPVGDGVGPLIRTAVGDPGTEPEPEPETTIGTEAGKPEEPGAGAVLSGPSPTAVDR